MQNLDVVKHHRHDDRDQQPTLWLQMTVGSALPSYFKANLPMYRCES